MFTPAPHLVAHFWQPPPLARRGHAARCFIHPCTHTRRRQHGRPHCPPPSCPRLSSVLPTTLSFIKAKSRLSSSQTRLNPCPSALYPASSFSPCLRRFIMSGSLKDRSQDLSVACRRNLGCHCFFPKHHTPKPLPVLDQRPLQHRHRDQRCSCIREVLC